MIKISWNREGYEITQRGRYNNEDLCVADYYSSIEDHVENIRKVLEVCFVGVEVEGI